MIIYYNAQTRGFYFANSPEGSVEVSGDKWRELLGEQEKGASIEPDKKGYPVAVYPKAPSLDDLRAAANDRITTWRDEQEAGSIVFDHDGRRWDGGKAVRERLQPAISAMRTVDIPGFIWTSADNEDVPMTLKELEVLAAAHDVAMVMQGNKIHIRQRQMKEAVAQMDEKQLAAFVPGWE